MYLPWYLIFGIVFSIFEPFFAKVSRMLPAVLEGLLSAEAASDPRAAVRLAEELNAWLTAASTTPPAPAPTASAAGASVSSGARGGDGARGCASSCSVSTGVRRTSLDSTDTHAFPPLSCAPRPAASAAAAPSVATATRGGAAAGDRAKRRMKPTRVAPSPQGALSGAPPAGANSNPPTPLMLGVSTPARCPQGGVGVGGGSPGCTYAEDPSLERLETPSSQILSSRMPSSQIKLELAQRLEVRTLNETSE